MRRTEEAVQKAQRTVGALAGRVDLIQDMETDRELSNTRESVGERSRTGSDLVGSFIDTEGEGVVSMCAASNDTDRSRGGGVFERSSSNFTGSGRGGLFMISSASDVAGSSGGGFFMLSSASDFAGSGGGGLSVLCSSSDFAGSSRA